MGHDSELYALTIDDDAAAATCGRSRIRRRATRRPDDLSLRAALADDRRRSRRCRRGRVLQYHNVTPAALLRALRPGAVPPGVARPRRNWRRSSAASISRSATPNTTGRSSRRSASSRPASSRSPSTPRASRSRSQRPALEQILDDGLVNFLFVGRIAPNKKIEDHIRLAELYKRYVDAYYRFIFVGRYDVVPRYYSMIRALMAEYRLLNDRFIFTGPVPDEELAVYYRHAAVYISLSEHEGFCVPLVEAMAADVPVLAYAAAAVPDTLGGAGVQFAPKDLEYAAELLGALAFDDDLRAEVIAGQRRRLADFGDARITPRARRAGASHSREARLHHPALRRRSPRRIRAPLPARRRAAGAARTTSRCSRPARATTSPGRTSTRKAPTASAASPSAGSPTRATRDIDAFNKLLGLDLQQPAQPRRRDGVAEAAGAVVPGADRATCGGSTSSTTC